MRPSDSESVCRRPEGAQSNAIRHLIVRNCGFMLFAHICVTSLK